PLRQRCRSPPLPGEIGGGELKLAEQVSGAGWSAAGDGEGLGHVAAVVIAAHRPGVAGGGGGRAVEEGAVARGGAKTARSALPETLNPQRAVGPAMLVGRRAGPGLVDARSRQPARRFDAAASSDYLRAGG